MFSTSPSITRSTSVPGMVPGDDRPPFVTFNKEGGFYISPEKEQRFQVKKKQILQLMTNNLADDWPFLGVEEEKWEENERTERPAEGLRVRQQADGRATEVDQ